jgi:hypothetical protein
MRLTLASAPSGSAPRAAGFKNGTTEWSTVLHRETANKVFVDARSGLRTAAKKRDAGA